MQKQHTNDANENSIQIHEIFSFGFFFFFL